jgi:SAM-dependent methyltransferase
MTLARDSQNEPGRSTHTLMQCRVCEGGVEFALTGREMMLGTREAFDYFECLRCGCLQIEDIPADLGRYYADEYYTQAQSSPGVRSRPSSSLRRAWSRFSLGESDLARRLSPRRYGRFDWFRLTQTGLEDAILDVGCGSGRLLRRLRAEGFEQLTGIDLHLRDDLLRDEALCFYRQSLEEHRGDYRLVMSHHSFEHMEDPVRAFAAFRRLVAPGGFLLLRLPMADSWAKGHYGANWVQLDPPRHLHLHTRRSVRLLAERSGFRVSQVIDDSGPFQIWGSEAYVRGVSLDAAGRGGRNEFSLVERLSARSRARVLSKRGAGDQACFYLERIAD